MTIEEKISHLQHQIASNMRMVRTPFTHNPLVVEQRNAKIRQRIIKLNKQLQQLKQQNWLAQ